MARAQIWPSSSFSDVKQFDFIFQHIVRVSNSIELSNGLQSKSTPSGRPKKDRKHPNFGHLSRKNWAWSKCLNTYKIFSNLLIVSPVKHNFISRVVDSMEQLSWNTCLWEFKGITCLWEFKGLEKNFTTNSHSSVLVQTLIEFFHPVKLSQKCF